MKFLKYADNKEKLKSDEFKKIVRKLYKVLDIQKDEYIIRKNIFHISFKEQLNENSFIIDI